MRRQTVDRWVRHSALLSSLGTGNSIRNLSTAAETFHILAETGDALLIETGDNLDYEHV